MDVITLESRAFQELIGKIEKILRYVEQEKKAKTEYENNTRPELKAYLKDISGYDNIFICGPCWCGTYPMAVFSLIESLNFQGKNVMPLMTHEGSGLGRSMQDINRICKGAVIKTGLAVHGADASKSEQAVTKWAKESLNV